MVRYVLLAFLSFGIVLFCTSVQGETSYAPCDDNVPFYITKSLTGVPAMIDVAGSVATDINCNVFVAGASEDGQGFPHMIIWKFDGYGELDQQFGNGGYKIFSRGTSAGADLAVDKAGKLVIFGWLARFNEAKSTLWRYKPEGKLDATFGGGNGFVEYEIPVQPGTQFTMEPVFYPEAVAIGKDNKIYISGTASDTMKHYIFVMRVLPTGVIDTAFGGGDGTVFSVIINNGPENAAYWMWFGQDIAIDPSGNILATGFESMFGPNYNLPLIRWQPSGALSGPLFAGNSYAYAKNDRSFSLKVSPDGTIYVAGTYRLYAFDQSGKPLTAFGNDGVVDYPLPNGGKLNNPWLTADQNDPMSWTWFNGANHLFFDKSTGRIIVAGSVEDGSLVWCFQKSGELCKDFAGGSGLVFKKKAGGGPWSVNDVTVATGGNIYVVGETENAMNGPKPDMFLWKVSAEGKGE